MPMLSTRALDPASLLAASGLANPARIVSTIRDTISLLELELDGLSVLTEAASGPFVVTPVIAAMAGAREVIAVTRDSSYATTASVVAQTRALEALCGIEGRVDIRTRRELDLFGRADIVTNLGFVRPLDRAAIGKMRSGTVIALMCEAWELRDSDIDLEACRVHGIPVYGTNEDFPDLEVFAYSGWVAVQLLLEAQLELHRCRIGIVGTDKFAAVIGQLLLKSGINATVHPQLDADVARVSDALLVADYTRHEPIIGEGGDLTAAELAMANPALTVVQFAGAIDVEGLRKAGISVHPGVPLPARRMARTLAALGPVPVIELHAAGLKVGQIAARPGGVDRLSRFSSLAQKLN